MKTRLPCAAALAVSFAALPVGAAGARMPADPMGLPGLYGGNHVCENGALPEITRRIAEDTPGNRFCMIWAGKTQPMFNISVAEETTHRLPLLSMPAPLPEGQADLSPVAVTVRFPDGSTFDGRGVYGTEKAITSTRMESLEAVLAGFSRPSVISITIGNTTQRFSAPALQKAVMAVRECAAARRPVAVSAGPGPGWRRAARYQQKP